MGTSAGSIGAQLWSNEVLAKVPYSKAAVIPDSFIAFFPPGTQGPFIKDFGMCTDSILPKNLQDECSNEQLTLQMMMQEFMKMNPNVPFSFIQSKEDDVQYSYYVAVAATAHVDPRITPDEFYANCSAILVDYNLANPNFLVYLVDGTQHTYTDKKLWYTSDPIGTHDDTVKPMMVDWTCLLPLAPGKSTNTVCSGDIQATVARPQLARNRRSNGTLLRSAMVTAVSGNNTYCSADLVPKLYTQQ